MKARIDEHLTYKTMFKLTIMPILMMVFTSIYSIVDGFCVASFCPSKASFAGLNIIFPMIFIIGGIGFMFGTGGSALSSKYLGEGNQKKANEVFSMLVLSLTIIGIILSLVGYFITPWFANLMASFTVDSTEEMVSEAIKYGKVLSLGQFLFMLQNLFQSYFIVAEKPGLCFKFSLLSGIVNIILDFLFIKVFQWGVTGAALATIVGMALGGIGPFIYFLLNKKNRVWLVKFKFDFKDLLQAIYNGSSEFVNNISSSIVGIMFNIQLLRFYGQDGVSAYGALMYISMIFFSVFIGYAIGVSPSASFQYGAKNHKELSTILKRCLFVIGFISIGMVILSEICAGPLSKIFSSGDQNIQSITVLAIRIFSISFLLSGFGIYSSSFFTALNNGTISAVISFFRCLVFQIGAVFLLPILIGKEGIWWSTLIAEIGSFILSYTCLHANAKKYHYFEPVALFD